MKYSYCGILVCPKLSGQCYTKSCEFYHETDDFEEYKNANRWKCKRWREKGEPGEIFDKSEVVKNGNAE